MNRKIFIYLILKNIIWSLTLFAIVLGLIMFDKQLPISDNLNNITMNVFTKLGIMRYESAKKNLEQIEALSLARNNAPSKLIATDNKPEQNPPANNAKPAENKPTIAEQAVIPLVKQVTDNALEPLKQQLTEQTKQIDNPIQKPKTPIATIKIYDKKTNREITIETPTQLQAQKKSLTLEEQQEQKDKDDRFKAYYQKSEKCLSPSDPQTRVECGNQYIRAKAKFEEIYKQGKF
jgi:hypothetical protein